MGKGRVGPAGKKWRKDLPMSDQDRFDWDDDLDFENLADEQAPSEAIPAGEQDFFADETVEPPTMAMEPPAPAEKETPPRGGASRQSRLGLSGAGLGFFFAISTLVAGIGLGGAILFVGGVDPLTLWNPEGLLQVDQWFNFQDYPLNVLYLLGMGIVTLALLGGWAVARNVKTAGDRYRLQAETLDSLTALRLDNEKPWQDPAFKADPRVAAFVAETLGSWRLQMAREKKNSGLEGELRRLQKAVESKNREDLVGRFDNPFAGTLADAILQLHDENEASRNEIQGLRVKDAHQSEDLMGLVQDARSWNRKTREKLAAQGLTVEKLAVQLGEMARQAESLTGDEESAAIGAAVADITREVEAWSQQEGPGEKLVHLNELVDKGSKLAFQVAMEVARLGTRGERLLPMTQALEELTTEFREAATALTDGGEGQNSAALKRRLDQVQERLARGPGPEARMVADKAQSVVAGANQVQQSLKDLAQNFAGQGSRLDNLGGRLADLTGVAFDATALDKGNPENPPEGGLNISQHDPFGQTQPAASTGSSEVDPFSTSAEASPLAMEPVLPTEEEKVYDLAEFGAVRIDQPDGAGDQADKVYDISDFGAVALT